MVAICYLSPLILGAKSFFHPPSPSLPVGGRGDKRKELLANAIYDPSKWVDMDILVASKTLAAGKVLVSNVRSNLVSV
jgi:hypothetical protein